MHTTTNQDFDTVRVKVGSEVNVYIIAFPWETYDGALQAAAGEGGCGGFGTCEAAVSYATDGLAPGERFKVYLALFRTVAFEGEVCRGDRAGLVA